MAKNNTELSVTFKLINQEFNTKLKEVNSSMKELRSEFALNESQFKLTGDKGTYLENKLKTLRSQEGLLKDKVQDAEKALQDTVAVYGENSKEAETMRTKLNYAKKEFAEVGTKIKQTEADLKAFNNQADLIDLDKKIKDIESQSRGLKVGQRFKDASDKIKEMSTKLKDASKKIQSFGKEVTTKVTLPLVGIGAAALKTSSDFDTAMSQVAATKGVGVDSIKELRDFAIEMGAKTAFSAKDAAEGLNYMALAGYDTQKSMAMLPTVLNLAAAGSMDLAKASDMVTDAASALGLSTEETTALVDNMAKTSSTTNTSVEQLGRAILKIGGTAKLMKGGPDELSQVLGILADNGIKGAKGGTVLRNMLLSLSSPTDKAAATLKDLGINVFDAQGNMRSMQDIMGDMNGALGKLTDEERTQAIASIFNKQDISAANALLDTSVERWNEVSEAISGAKDSAAEMAKTQLDNLEGSITLLQSALSSAGIAIGSVLTPYIRGLADWLTELVTKFNDLSDRNKTIITFIGLFIAAIGPVATVLGVVVGAIGSVASVIGTVVGAIGTAITFITNMGGVIATVSAGFQAFIAVIGSVVATIGAIPIAIGAVIAIFVLLYAKCEWFRNGVNAVISAVVNAFKSLPKTAENVKNSVVNAFNALKAKVASIWNAIKTAVMTPVNAIKSAVTKAVAAIKSALSFNGLKATVTKVFNSIKSAITKPIDAAKTKVKSIIDGIKNLFPLNVGKIFTGLKIPKIVVSGGKLPYGIGGLGTPPKIDIKWNKIAEDMPYLFKKGGATLFGAGDANDEIIYGRENLMNDITKAMSRASYVGDTTQNFTFNVYGAEGQSVNDLAREVEKRLINAQNRRRVVWGQ